MSKTQAIELWRLALCAIRVGSTGCHDLQYYNMKEHCWDSGGMRNPQLRNFYKIRISNWGVYTKLLLSKKFGYKDNIAYSEQTWVDFDTGTHAELSSDMSVLLLLFADYKYWCMYIQPGYYFKGTLNLWVVYMLYTSKSWKGLANVSFSYYCWNEHTHVINCIKLLVQPITYSWSLCYGNTMCVVAS